MKVLNRFTDETIGQFKISSFSNLSGASLSEADLSWIRGVSISSLPDWYFPMIGWMKNNHLYILSGCRSFSVKEAISHWSSEKYKNSERGKKRIEEIKFHCKIWGIEYTLAGDSKII